MNFLMRSRVWIYMLLLAIAACKPAAFVVKDGQTAKDLLLFNQSIDFLTKEFNEERDPLKQQKIAFQIADSYKKFNDYANAEKWYKQSLDLNGGEQALFEMGLMQKQQEKYDEAIRSFEQYQRLTGNGFEGRKQSNQCLDAIQWKKAFTKVQITNLAALNTKGSDYNLEPYKGNQFVFTSAREECLGTDRDGWTGDKFTDLFIADKKDNSFSAPINFGTPVNTPSHESSATFSKDFKEVYFIRCVNDSKQSNQYCHLYYTAFNNDHWSEPVKLDVFADTINVYDPYLSKDGQQLYLAANVPGNFGSTDLYVMNKVDSGWSAPLSLGGIINTLGSERSPWLDERGNLYFSSNGLPGMGGLDIFKSVHSKSGFKEPQNLKAPFNSGGDDFGFRIDKYKPINADDTVLYSGYLTSNRAGGKGSDDIYRFEEKWINIFVLKGKVVEKDFENPDDPDSKVLGMKPLPKAKVDLKTTDDRSVRTLYSDTGGAFLFRLEAETDYKLTAGKNGYFNKTDYVSTKGLRNQDSTFIYLYAELELEKIFTTKMIVIPNIYYDYDKANLRPESKLVLDTVYQFFVENPDLTVEIGSHTDSRGSDAYNIKLSQARAQSVVDYLVQKGVPAERLIAKGYGESVPVNNCGNGSKCTEEEYQKNRRTTFRVVSAKLNLESVQPEDIKVDPKKE